MPWPLKRRGSYLVQWFFMTKKVQFNRLVVYGCKRFSQLYSFPALDYIISITELIIFVAYLKFNTPILWLYLNPHLPYLGV